jgi:PKD domain-containing protein
MGKGGALLAMLAVALVVAGPAQAAPGWASPASILSSGGSPAVSPDVVLLPTGETVAVWWAERRIRAAVRQPGGAFGEAVVLSGDLPDSPDPAPQLALARDGRVLVTWVENEVVKTAFRSPGGAFGPATSLSGPGAGAPRSVFTTDGRAMVVWDRLVRSRNVIQVEAVVSDVGGAFSRLGTTIDSGGVDRPTPAIAADSAGNGYVVWAINDGTTAHLKMRKSPRDSTGFPLQIELTSQPGLVLYSAPAVAAGADGTAAVAWLRLDVRGTESGAVTTIDTVQTMIAGTDPELTRGQIQSLDFGVPASDRPVVRGTFLSGPRVAVDTTGAATAVWTTSSLDSKVGTVRRATRLPGDTRFGPTLDVASGGGADAPTFRSATVGSLGNGAVGLTFVRGSGVVQAAVAREQGNFAAPESISPAGASTRALPRMSGDPAGDAVAVWSNGDGSASVAVYDATPPELRDLKAAPEAIAGQPIDFAVSPFDAWTATTVAWHFGDETPLVGGNVVSHAFARAGTFTVTVAAADALGNSSTATREVHVTAPDTTAPTIRSLRLTRRRFAVSRRATALVAAAKLLRGSTIRYRISEPATLKLYVNRALAGRRRGKRCSTQRATGRRCTVYRRAGALTRRAASELGGIAFSGRMARKPLRPGRYRITAVAIDANGNRSQRRYVSFRIVRR